MQFWDFNPGNSATHIKGVLSHLSEPNLYDHLQTWSETLFLGNTRSCKCENINHHWTNTMFMDPSLSSHSSCLLCVKSGSPSQCAELPSPTHASFASGTGCIFEELYFSVSFQMILLSSWKMKV